jgi:putative proteasome-type protease
MTYCIGLYLEEGLVMLADTRTNAGVDNISTYSKTFTWETPGERALTLMTSGNLAVTQAVIHHLNAGLSSDSDPDAQPETLYSVASPFQAARLVGRAVRRVYVEDAEAMRAQDASFQASFLLGGQIQGSEMALFQIYSAGNFIRATQETPFLQIGEHKYGKPILDRALKYQGAGVMDGVKLALLSMDSTVRSNLSVGFPLDLVVMRRNEHRLALKYRIEDNDPYFQKLSRDWSDALRAAYQNLLPPEWL